MLFLSAAACISLSSCDVTSKKYTLLSYTTADGSTQVDYTTNELLLKYLTEDSASTSELYDIIYEAMLKKYYSDDSRSTQLRELERLTDQQVEDYKDEAEDNADSSSISYSDAWEAILDEQLSDLQEDRRDEDALWDKLLVENMKDAIGDEFYDEFKDWKEDTSADDYDLQKQFNIFWGENGYLENRKPYHVSHILVELDAEDDTIYDAEISSDDAEEIYNVLDPLAHSDSSFGTVAEDHSADSADNFGNLGIMDIATSYVDEFKLGIYIYDTLFNTDDDVEDYLETNSDPFNMGDENKDFFEELGVGFIPYEAVEQLYNYRNQTLSSSGLEVNEGNAAYYPRNIIFNTYFNTHSVSFITKEQWSYSDADSLVSSTRTATNGETIYSDVDEEGWWSNGNAIDDITLTGFKDITFNTYDSSGNASTVTKSVLCDEDGNPIMVVRAGTDDYQGIHFIVVERSGIDNSQNYGETGDTSTLAEYFAAEAPISVSGSGYGLNTDAPTYTNAEGETVAKTTYINNVVSTYEDYQSRAEDLKDTIKDFDEAYDQRIYTWLKATTDLGSTITVTFSDGETETTVDINEKVDNYVNRIIAQTASSYTIDDDTWEDYVEYLTNQTELRTTKLIPITCAVNFSSGWGDESSNLYKVCNYES